MSKTIVAIATAPGNAGIGIIRMSGEESFTIIQKIFKSAHKKQIKGYTMQYGKIVGEKKEEIDEVLVSFFVAPNSYTGENSCEINSHGNQVILNQILQICLQNGAVLAEPGEFTKRAFLNGRIDLVQAEAVMDLIHSKSELEKKQALKSLEGNLSRKIKKIKEQILSILTELEVSIDYPEYDIEERTKEQNLKLLNVIENTLIQLENSFHRGKILKDGVKVAIVGRPNAGKSSILNTMLKEDRAIVTDIEGTTRDTIEEFVTIKGILFKIIDTAGIREANNEIEKIGIEKSKKALENSDLAIAVFDQSKKLTKEDIEILEYIQNKNAIIVLNKTDLEKKIITKQELEKYNQPIVAISTKTGSGVEKLYEKMAELFISKGIEVENVSIITNLRHEQAIQRARREIKDAKKVMEKNQTCDIIALYLKKAIETLNEITGENATEDLLKDIFSKFCLGK